MRESDFAVVFWRSESSGYTYNVEEAGLYTEEEIKRFENPHDDSPIAEEVITPLLEKYVIDEIKLGSVVVNTKKNRKILKIKLKELLVGVYSNWDSRAFLTPEEFVKRYERIETLLEETREYLKKEEK